MTEHAVKKQRNHRKYAAKDEGGRNANYELTDFKSEQP